MVREKVRELAESLQRLGDLTERQGARLAAYSGRAPQQGGLERRGAPSSSPLEALHAVGNALHAIGVAVDGAQTTPSAAGATPRAETSGPDGATQTAAGVAVSTPPSQPPQDSSSVSRNDFGSRTLRWCLVLEAAPGRARHGDDQQTRIHCVTDTAVRA
jgi:hypothetical protein